jgi:hypothetical protein
MHARWLPCALLLLCGTAQASGVVIYRCTDASGALTVQNDVPCPKGSRQKKQVIQAPAAMPAYRPAPRPPVAMPDPAPAAPAAATQSSPATTAPATAPAAAAIADADRLPPPALYRCNTFDNDSYLSEDNAPAPRCVRLRTTDLSGNTDDSAGTACQMVTDQCQRIPDGAACAAWTQRLREVQSASTFAAAGTADAAKVELGRVQTIVRDSTCGR